MAEPTGITDNPHDPTGVTDKPAAPSTDGGAPAHQPYIPDSANIPEFTWPAVLLGALLGILFGASSLYLLLKVGMTVSASVPIAVLSITLFRAFSQAFGIRKATILENNIVQTAGSAGESLAFGVGVTMPALLLLGFEMSWVRVMTVSILGGLLGVLLMIPLRRAFIVKQHGKLKYPEGTACAEVLVAGEKGGSSAAMVFIGFGIAFVYKILMKAGKLWADEPEQNLYTTVGGTKVGLKGAAISGDLSPEMLGVGYLIGPRIACLMMAGAVLSFFIFGPLIATFGEGLNHPMSPARSAIMAVEEAPGDTEEGRFLGDVRPSEVQKYWRAASLVSTLAQTAGTGPLSTVAALQTPVEDKGLIRNMEPGIIYKFYLRYIGAGAVAAGGIISMCRALPLILSSIFAGLRDLRSGAGGSRGRRTERDLPMSVVLFGSLGLVIVLAAIPQLGLGLSLEGVLGAIMILVFGFLFVTVSSRLTGEVGSSSNPISGMTIATLLLTCLIFVLVGRRDLPAMLTALSVAAVVCIASSNGGTTSQDLKTGYLVGGTPKWQQYAILIGALTSAILIGLTMIALNSANTHYTKKGVVDITVAVFPDDEQQQVGRPYDDKDNQMYTKVFLQEIQRKKGNETYFHLVDGSGRDRLPPQKGSFGIDAGWYLVDANHRLTYKVDVPIKRDYKVMDDGSDAPDRFKAPQPQLFAIIIKGILGGDLEWGLVVCGALVAIAMELLGISALPVAVGMYLGLGTATPIFLGGILRWLGDRRRGVSASEAETETSPGVLFSSGYIAGGTLCGLLIGFLFMWKPKLAISGTLLPEMQANILSLVLFLGLGAILLWIGSQRTPRDNGGPPPEV
jgi:uncharacterized oligopeptide transporter (OPT) family protein